MSKLTSNSENAPLAAIEDDTEFGALVEDIRDSRAREGLHPDTGRPASELPPDQQAFLDARNELVNALHDLRKGTDPLSPARARDSIDFLIMARLEWAQKKSQQAAALADMVRFSEDAGLYDEESGS